MHRDVLDGLLAEEHDCVGAWQLVEAGWEPKHVARRLRSAGLRPAPGMAGVWTSARGALTTEQRWRAATLTAPDTALSHISAALYEKYGDRRGRELYIVVTRPGTGGPRRHGDVLVTRSTTSITETTNGIRHTTAACTLVDLAPLSR